MVVEYQWVNGFKGLIIAGLMAMIMSTVDSLINSNAVLLIHDLRQPLRLKFIQNELLSTRVCAAIIGVIAILFALRGGNFFELIVWTSTMYMPIVTVPFIMTLLGFRSSGNSVVAGMIAGFVMVVIWEGMNISQHMAGIGALIPAIISNLVVLLGYHYYFNENGGWVGIKDPTILEDLKKEKIKKREELIYSIKHFNFINFLKSTTPKSEGVIALLGVSIIVLIFISAASLTTELRVAYKEIIEVSYISTLFFTASLISYPVWDSKWKGKTFIAICWNATIFYVLACFGFFMVLLSNFGDMQMIIYMVSVLLIVSIMDWRWSLAVLVVGMVVVSSLYKAFIMPELIIKDISYELKILYIIFMVVGVVIAFLKPKQEYVEATEAKVGTLEFKVTDLGHEVEERGHKIVDLNEKVTYFEEKIEDQAKEIERLGATAQRILNNLNHELRIPVGNVMNFSEMLAEGLGKYNESQLKMLSDEVHKNSNRLSTMILNMLDLATLNATKIKLQKKTINLGDLVEERVKRCRKIYLQGKLINFKLEIESELLIMIDPNYIRQVVDNLVINAINFSKKGLIEVSVRKQKDNVIITVKDEGIGVPKNEKHDIFTPFKMGSNAESKAEGRGVGLALCKTAIEEHGGQISVNSENGKTLFRVVLPM
ncbi:MAG: ATP-binding protein [Rickettsiaceae bacterium]|nr:ATP-binding protein [Rickettsiaceae bacterium]